MADYSPTEWHLKLCNVKEAWELTLPSHGLGKSHGEGITILHPDTGWTKHPELINGGRYLIDDYKISRNFLVHTPTDNYDYWDLPSDSPDWASRIDKPDDKYANDLLEIGDLLFPSHGTSVASIVLSEEGYPTGHDDYDQPTSMFVTGIAPKVQVIPCKVTRSVFLRNDPDWGINTVSTLAKCVQHARSLQIFKNIDVGVISISLGNPSRGFEVFGGERSLTSALKLTRKWGIITIAATGQIPGYDLTDLPATVTEPAFPGSSIHTICVAGCDESYNQPAEGTYGDVVDVTAPGWGIIVAKSKSPPLSYYMTSGSGTSYSTSLTAGACALWQAFHSREYLIKKYGLPFLTDVFKYVLEESSYRPAGWDSSMRGCGVLDVKKLLEVELPTTQYIERFARDNGWKDEDWGDLSEWGRGEI